MKYLALLAARNRAAESLDRAVIAEAQRIDATPGLAVSAFRQLPEDPFGSAVPGMRTFDATIEIRGEDHSLALGAIAGMAERLDAVVHADLSALLAGRDHVVIACEPTAVRYQYVMRRKIATTHEQYIDHYVNRHAEFGRVTPGIEGYTQFHVDATLSRAAAAAAEFGVWRVDSVSELHLMSVETFLSALAESSPSAEAGKDEERFVDRPNSVMFTSAVLWRS